MASSLHSLIFAITLAVFAEAGVIDNCDVSASVKPSEVCGEVVSFGLNSTQIKEILDALKSNNFGPLKWSEELATRAQARVNQCKFSYNPCLDYHHSDSISSLDSSNDVSLTKLINSLYNHSNFEIPDFDKNKFEIPSFDVPFFDVPYLDMPTFEFPNFKLINFEVPDAFLFRKRRSLTGDYTDMVGCGFIATKQQRGVLKQLVCYFGPTGDSNEQPAH